MLKCLPRSPGDAAAPVRNAGRKENLSQAEGVGWDWAVDVGSAAAQSLVGAGRGAAPVCTLQVVFFPVGCHRGNIQHPCSHLQHLIYPESSCWDKDELSGCLSTFSGGRLASSHPPFCNSGVGNRRVLSCVHTSSTAPTDEVVLINSQPCLFLSLPFPVSLPAISAFKQLLRMPTK